MKALMSSTGVNAAHSPFPEGAALCWLQPRHRHGAVGDGRADSECGVQM